MAAHPDKPFADPEAVARYAEGPPRIVPGFADMQRMAAILLAEQAGPDAHVLVLGAGGGLELKAFAEARPGWRFTGIDPSAEMLALARSTLGPLTERIDLHHGYIDTAPQGPFDAATALLTFHFISPDDRRQTLAALRSRLKPGAPLVLVHLSMPDGEPARTRWFERYAAFATSSGTPIKPETARAAMDARLTILSPEEDKAMLREAGFSDVELFYAAFAFRGWVARA